MPKQTVFFCEQQPFYLKPSKCAYLVLMSSIISVWCVFWIIFSDPSKRRVNWKQREQPERFNNWMLFHWVTSVEFLCGPPAEERCPKTGQTSLAFYVSLQTARVCLVQSEHQDNQASQLRAQTVQHTFFLSKKNKTLESPHPVFDEHSTHSVVSCSQIVWIFCQKIKQHDSSWLARCQWHCCRSVGDIPGWRQKYVFFLWFWVVLLKTACRTQIVSNNKSTNPNSKKLIAWYLDSFVICAAQRSAANRSFFGAVNNSQKKFIGHCKLFTLVLSQGYEWCPWRNVYH